MKYRVLIDYRTEGFKFHDGEFDNVDEAVKCAMENCYGSPFFIVTIIEWEAKEKHDVTG